MNSVSTGSETRTQTPVKATDFESVVSTISPTRQVLKLYQKNDLQCNRKSRKIIKNLLESLELEKQILSTRIRK